MESDTRKHKILLKRATPENLSRHPKIENLEQIYSIEKCITKNNHLVSFDRNILSKDVEYLKHKIKQLRKKKYHKVINGCWKILHKDPCYMWAYMIAGATCRKYEKHSNAEPLYFSCAALVNPNCLTAWSCLFKYYLANGFDATTFEVVFSGMLFAERNPEKWTNIVNELLQASFIIPDTRPLKLLAPYLQKNEKAAFLSKSISLYAIKNMEKKHQFNDIKIAMGSFKLYYDNDFDPQCIKRILAYTFYCGQSTYFNDFVEHISHHLSPEKHLFKTNFLKKLFTLILYNNPTSRNDVIAKFVTTYQGKFRIRRKHILGHVMRILYSYGDYRRARDIYKKINKRGRFPSIKTRVSGIWSSIKLENYEIAWNALLKSTQLIYLRFICKSKRRKTAKKIKPMKKVVLRKSHFLMWLHLLTSGPTYYMRKLGVLLCIKALNEGDSIDLLFYACVGCIGLNLNDLAILFMKKLHKSGAIQEVLYLKALLEDDFQNKTVILKELPDLTSSHKLCAVFSYESEKLIKAFKTICKASVLLSDCTFLYEWLGIFFYEKGDFERAEKYFEVALLYNSDSWISINYYSTLLAKHDIEASKLFLDLYRSSKPRRHNSCVPLVALKAGIMYFKHNSQKMDYYKAAENFRHGMSCSRVKRHFKQMLGESYSLFGMVGVSRKWLSDCYISSNRRDFYAGSQLGKQYLFLKGVSKYSKFMRKLVSTGGLDHFLCLYNAAHAFLLKSINLLHKNRQHLSQLYCQSALIMCVRALVISSHFACAWKMLGDILYQCANLNHFAGYLYVPNWLLPEYSSGKLICIRRLQSLLLGIRCYYTALNSVTCTKEMKACLWNSISVAYKKVSTLSSRDNKKKLLMFGIDSSLKAIEANPKDSFSWNTLGVLLKSSDDDDSEEVFQCSSSAIESSQRLSENLMFRLIAKANLGFLHLSALDFERAYYLFLSVRGHCTSLDFSWIGQIFLNLICGYDDYVTVNNILFIYTLTHHVPSIKLLFTYILFLSQHCPESLTYIAGKVYTKYSGIGVSSFNECVLSSILNHKRKKIGMAKQDLLYALRTCNGLKNDDLASYNSAIYELHFLLKKHREQLILLNLSHMSIKNIRLVFSLCEKYLNSRQQSKAILELLKQLSFESNLDRKKVLNWSLSAICFNSGNVDHAKYFLKQEY